VRGQQRHNHLDRSVVSNSEVQGQAANISIFRGKRVSRHAHPKNLLCGGGGVRG